MSKINIFPYPTIFGIKFWGVPFGVMLGSAESRVPKLIIHEIIFEEFQRV